MKSFADGRDSSDLIAGCNSPANKAIPGDHPAAEQIMRFFFFFLSWTNGKHMARVAR